MPARLALGRTREAQRAADELASDRGVRRHGAAARGRPARTGSDRSARAIRGSPSPRSPMPRTCSVRAACAPRRCRPSRGGGRAPRASVGRRKRGKPRDGERESWPGSGWSCRSARRRDAARRADSPRARSASTAGAGTLERRDCGGAGAERAHGRVPRREHLLEDRRLRAHRTRRRDRIRARERSRLKFGTRLREVRYRHGGGTGRRSASWPHSSSKQEVKRCVSSSIRCRSTRCPLEKLPGLLTAERDVVRPQPRVPRGVRLVRRPRRLRARRRARSRDTRVLGGWKHDRVHAQPLRPQRRRPARDPHGPGPGRPVADVDQVGAAPSYSPDGTRIAYASIADHHGKQCGSDQCFWSGELYVADADGTQPRRLTKDEGDISIPRWSPDGSRICSRPTATCPTPARRSCTRSPPTAAASPG